MIKGDAATMQHQMSVNGSVDMVAQEALLTRGSSLPTCPSVNYLDKRKELHPSCKMRFIR